MPVKEVSMREIMCFDCKSNAKMPFEKSVTQRSPSEGVLDFARPRKFGLKMRLGEAYGSGESAKTSHSFSSLLSRRICDLYG